MALALDVSTPVAVTITQSGLNPVVTTAAFTPPVGAIIVVVFCTNSGTGSSLSNFAVTDSLGTHLTYTVVQHIGNATNDTQVSSWSSSAIVTSTSMTVSASYSDTQSVSNQQLLRVLVFTGADTTAPIGAKGGSRITTRVNASYVSTRTASWGWMGYADWTQQGIPSVTGAESVDASYDVAGQDTYAVIKQNAVSGSTGSTVVISTATPNTATQISYCYFEVVPALVGPTIGSVPSGANVAAGSLSARFLVFDTSDYSRGL